MSCSAKHAQERDRKKREAVLHQIQVLIHNRVIHYPIFEPAIWWGHGGRGAGGALEPTTLLPRALPAHAMKQQ